MAGKADTCQLFVSFTLQLYGKDGELCNVILIDLVFCIRFLNLLRVNHRNRLYCSKVHGLRTFPPCYYEYRQSKVPLTEDICNVMCTHDMSVRPSWYDLILHHPPDSWCWQNTVVHLRDPWDHNYVSKQIGIYESWGDYVFFTVARPKAFNTGFFFQHHLGGWQRTSPPRHWFFSLSFWVFLLSFGENFKILTILLQCFLFFCF